MDTEATIAGISGAWALYSGIDMLVRPEKAAEAYRTSSFRLMNPLMRIFDGRYAVPAARATGCFLMCAGLGLLWLCVSRIA